MRVALEASAALAHRFTGVQRYIYELSQSLAKLQEPELHCQMLFRLTNLRKRRLRPAFAWPSRWYCSGPWPLFPRVDVVHGLANRLPHVYPRRPLVCTIHDVFAITLSGFGSRRNNENTLRQYAYAAANADRIIAVSATTKNEFLKYYEFSDERIDVIYHGLNPAFISADAGATQGAGQHPDRPYFIAFSGTPRKNLPRIIEAFGRSAAAAGADLSIVGPIDDESGSAIARLGLGERVNSIGNIEEHDLVRFFSGAAGLVFPSIEEGFGIPILEAMACRIPVLTSDRSAMEEIAGGHAVLVDPESVDAIANGIDGLLSFTDAELDAAAAYAKAFTWACAAEQTLQVYRDVAR